MTLRDLRRALPMTMQELADKLGVSFNTYKSWEYGTRRPLPEHIRALAAIFGASTHEIIFVLERTKMAREAVTSTRLTEGIQE